MKTLLLVILVLSGASLSDGVPAERRQVPDLLGNFGIGSLVDPLTSSGAGVVGGVTTTVNIALVATLVTKLVVALNILSPILLALTGVVTTGLLKVIFDLVYSFVTFVLSLFVSFGNTFCLQAMATTNTSINATVMANINVALNAVQSAATGA